jgi:hypothetical protein
MRKPEADTARTYNAGREALAPNFARYERLGPVKMPDGKSALNHLFERYQKDMNGTRITSGEFIVFLKCMDKNETLIQDIPFQVGSLALPQYRAMRNEGVPDSKIMAIQRQLGHGTGGKNALQKIPEDRYEELYQVLQSPEHIYENTKPASPLSGREFHFTGKRDKEGEDTQCGTAVFARNRVTSRNNGLARRTAWAEKQYA